MTAEKGHWVRRFDGDLDWRIEEREGAPETDNLKLAKADESARCTSERREMSADPFEKDYRPEDMEKLRKIFEEENWERFWEDSAKDFLEIKPPQQLWHISRMSYLQGYKSRVVPIKIKKAFEAQRRLKDFYEDFLVTEKRQLGWASGLDDPCNPRDSAYQDGRKDGIICARRLFEKHFPELLEKKINEAASEGEASA